MKDKIELDYLSYILSRMKGGSRFDLKRQYSQVG